MSPSAKHCKTKAVMYLDKVRLLCYNLFLTHYTRPFSLLTYRSKTWWEYVVLQPFSDSHWLPNFRVSKDTFLFICTKLRSYIERQDTNMRRSVSVEHRTATTLWCLATPCEDRTVGHLFDVAKCTVCHKRHKYCVF